MCIRDSHIGDEITYTIAVSNPGKTNATNIVIKDVLPEGLKFINEMCIRDRCNRA